MRKCQSQPARYCALADFSPLRPQHQFRQPAGTLAAGQQLGDLFAICSSTPRRAASASARFGRSHALFGPTPIAGKNLQRSSARQLDTDVIAIAAGCGRRAWALDTTRRRGSSPAVLPRFRGWPVRAGAKRETLAGLTGLGDLVLTCTGSLSRNRHVGIELARGRSLQDVLAA